MLANKIRQYKEEIASKRISDAEDTVEKELSAIFRERSILLDEFFAGKDHLDDLSSIPDVSLISIIRSSFRKYKSIDLNVAEMQYVLTKLRGCIQKRIREVAEREGFNVLFNESLSNQDVKISFWLQNE